MKIIHVTSGLDGGGAEMMLFKLLSEWNSPTDEIEVISLTDRGVMGDRIEKLGIPIITLGMPRGRPSIVGVLRLAVRLWKSSPAIVHCWMYHGNLVGGLAARIGRQHAIVWGIRSSNLDKKGNRRTTRWTAAVGAKLSRVVPHRIVSCSEIARQNHVLMGYSSERMIVIPNGFDLTYFKPNQTARLSIRAELGIAADALLIGFVARFDPQKDHRNFISAAQILDRRGVDAHYLLCGHLMDNANAELTTWVEQAGLRQRIHLLGRRNDMATITASLDIATCTSSFGEAFPNVLGEAMACAVPCVATDVGDSAHIIGGTGLVVKPGDSRLLADAWLRMIEGGPAFRHMLGKMARQRVMEKFELRTIVEQYRELYLYLSETKKSCHELRNLGGQ